MIVIPPKKILFILNSLGTGGSERVVLEICKGLDKTKFTPFVVSLNSGELSKRFEKHKIWCKCLYKKKGVDLLFMIKLISIVREEKIDIINAHHFSPFIHSIFSSVFNLCPVIYTEHTAAEIKEIPFYWRLIGTFILKFSKGAIGISGSVSKALTQFFYMPPSKIQLILNGIDLSRFEIPVDIKMKRESLGINENKKVIGVIGNLRLQKNHELLLEAFQRVTNKLNDVVLLIVGDGPERDKLTSMAKKWGIANKVIFLGVRFDVEQLYKIIDIYCLCSHYEGLPLSILESMASGIPVIGTDVAGINEVIDHNQTGIIVEPDHPIKLAEAILYLLSDKNEADKLAKNGNLYVRKNHSMKIWIDQYQEYFLEI